jgi:hypothetical protein
MWQHGSVCQPILNVAQLYPVRNDIIFRPVMFNIIFGPINFLTFLAQCGISDPLYLTRYFFSI